MPSVIVPVGLDLGPTYPIVGKPIASAPPEYCKVRFRQDLEELTSVDYVVWASAFGDANSAIRFEMNRETIIGEVPQETRDTADVNAVIDDLLKRDLLFEYDIESLGGEDVLRRLQIYPTAQGQGNEASDPGWFYIGNRGEKLIKVSATVYALWSFSISEPSLWDACVKLANTDGTDLVDMPVTEAVQAIGANVPLLLSSGCAFIDWLI